MPRRNDELSVAKRELSKARQEDIVKMAESGQTSTDIAHVLEMNDRTVRRIIAKHRKSGDIQNVKRIGRPRKTSENFDRRLKIISMCDSTKRATKVLHQTCAGGNPPISIRTARRRIKATEAGAGDGDGEGEGAGAEGADADERADVTVQWSEDLFEADVRASSPVTSPNMASDNQRLPQVIVSRTETFSASHRLHSPYLTDEENKDLYGKCNNYNGHGHNYKVDLMLKGPVDPATGMVINITDLKKAMNEAIMDVLDHKNIDKDVPYFGSIPSTAENITIFIWNQMIIELKKIHREYLLHEVKLSETEKNVFYYRGEIS